MCSCKMTHATEHVIHNTMYVCMQAAAGMSRSLAKPGIKKPGVAVKPMLAAFGPGDSDDDS